MIQGEYGDVAKSFLICSLKKTCCTNAFIFI